MGIITSLCIKHSFCRIVRKQHAINANKTKSEAPLQASTHEKRDVQQQHVSPGYNRGHPCSVEHHF